MYFEPPLGGTFELYQSATDNVVQWVARHGKPSVGAERTKNASIASGEDQGQKRSTYHAHEQNEKNRKRHQTKSIGDGESSSTMELSYGTLRQLGKAIACADGLDVEFNVLVLLHGIIHARKGFAT